MRTSKVCFSCLVGLKKPVSHSCECDADHEKWLDWPSFHDHWRLRMGSVWSCTNKLFNIIIINRPRCTIRKNRTR